MSDYNADPNPDTDRMRQVAFAYGFAYETNLRTDQFSTLTSLKVYKFVTFLGGNNLRVLVDPTQLPHL